MAHMKTFLLILVVWLLGGCSKPKVDRTTPQLAAKSVVDALNSGDLEAVKLAVGDDFIARTEKQCRELKTKPPPKEPTGAWAAMMRPIYEIEVRRRERSCEAIGTDFKALLGRLKGSAGLSVAEVEHPFEKEASKARIGIRSPDGTGTEKWVFNLVNGLWTLSTDAAWGGDIGWFPDSGSLAQTAKWVASEDLKKALRK